LKHFALLSILFYLASCVQGEQKVASAQGVSTSVIQPSQTSVGCPGPSPIPPEIAFPPCTTSPPPNNYPFTRLTSPVELQVSISNPNNLNYTQQWVVNGSVFSTNQNSFWIEPGDTNDFPNYGLQVVSSILRDSSNQVISTLSWSFNIVTGIPGYLSLQPLPTPNLYPGSPVPIWNSPQTMTATIENAGGTPYYH
jgi:hypothetical protein